MQNGIACNECQYSAVDKRVMKKHFIKHERLKASKNVTECNVQLIFKGDLQKYIQIEDEESKEMNNDEGNEFHKTLGLKIEVIARKRNTSESNDQEDLRLMTTFIAKYEGILV